MIKTNYKTWGIFEKPLSSADQRKNDECERPSISIKALQIRERVRFYFGDFQFKGGAFVQPWILGKSYISSLTKFKKKMNSLHYKNRYKSHVNFRLNAI